MLTLNGNCNYSLVCTVLSELLVSTESATLWNAYQASWEQNIHVLMMCTAGIVRTMADFIIVCL